MARRSMVSPPGARAARRPRRRLGASSVPAIRPSASRMTRSAYAAAIGSWVTITTVWPSASTTSRRSASTPRPVLGVERSGGLVGEHDLGPGDERPGDRDALLLAAGELRGTVAQALVEPDPRGDLAHLRAPRAAAVEAQRQADVLGDRQRRHQVEGLEDEADALAPQDRQPPLAEPGEVDARRARRCRTSAGPARPPRAGTCSCPTPTAP